MIMKTKYATVRLVTAGLLLASATAIRAQGTVTFDQPWLINGIQGYSFYYDASGLGMVVNPGPPQPHDSMTRVGVGLAGHPSNGTPHMEFVNMLSISEYVVFSLTTGNAFGVTSVDLADTAAPSTTPVSITFNGFRTDGSMVSETFTVGGGGASTFQTYSFDTDFANGLLRVEIPSAAWAADNIVWVPEPSSVGLLFVGLLVFAARRRRRTVT